jgi:DDE superfamily endonuclease
VLAWLARHPRSTFHFTPTSASWLNAVENFFSKMTRQCIRRGVFHSIADLQATINAYLVEHNAGPKLFVWTNPPRPFRPNSTAVLYHPVDSVHRG